MSDGLAEITRTRVEQLEAAGLVGQGMTRELAVWVRDLPDELHGKLARCGMVTPRSSGELATVVADFLADKAGNKAGSRLVVEYARRDLLTFFGETRNIRTITAAGGDRWHAWLRDTRGLAKASIGKRVRIARELVKRARRDRLTDAHPFDNLSGAVASNPKRKRFIEQAVIEEVIGVCPDA